MKWLTKSDYIYGYRVAPALLWVKKHQPDRLPEVDQALQYRFDQGHRLTELAQQKFAGGALVAGDTLKSLDETTQAMKSSDIVYEPAMLADGRLYARADIIIRAEGTGDRGEGVWDMYEVKSAASYHRHPEYLLDLAFQKIVWERAGIKIGKLGLVLVNSHYECKGKVDPTKLFYTADVTEAVEAVIAQVEADIPKALAIIDAPACPELSPLDCGHLNTWLPTYEHLAGELPKDSIFKLAFVSKAVATKLHEAGYKKITDITDPDKFALSPAQRGQWQTLKAGKPTIHALKIDNYLRKLKYPLYFLDYETVAPAVPLYEGTRPYQTTPFQYSIQVVDSPGAEPRELKFLHMGADNPALLLLDQLQKDIGTEGSIVVWSDYERSVHTGLAAHYPGYKDFLNGLNRRLFDLMQVFKQQMYVDAGFGGSASIKKVLPVLVPELSYANLAIGEGQTASNKWVEAITGVLPKEEAEQVFKDLETYCGQDTMAMVEIYNLLASITEQAVPKLDL